MVELKPGWRRVRLGDVVRQVKEKVDPATSGLDRFVAGDHMDTDAFRIRRWGNLGEGYLGPAFHMRFRPGQVLYGSRRTYLRKVAMADFDGICANTTFVLESADAMMLLPELLPFIMSTDSFHEHSRRESKGSVNPYVNFSDLAWYEFALPPLDEQRRMGALLSAMGETFEAHFDGLTTLEVARDSAIGQMLASGIRGARLTRTALGLRPENWTVEPVTRRYDVQLGKMISEKTQGPGVRRPYLRNANIDWGRFDLDDLQEMSLDDDEVARYEVREGDILACEGRHVGKSAIWRGEIEGICFQKALHRLRVRDLGRDVPDYMLLVLRDYYISGRLLRHSTGTTIPHLPLANLRAIQVAFPPPDEQKEIVLFIAELDSARSSLRRRQREIRDTLKSILSSLDGVA